MVNEVNKNESEKCTILGLMVLVTFWFNWCNILENVNHQSCFNYCR